MPELDTGRVVVSYSRDSIIEDFQGNLFRCTSRRNAGKPYCGDYVHWQRTGEDEGVIESIEPRRNLIARPNYRGDLKGMAANVDLMIIAIAVQPKADIELIDRYLVLTEDLGIEGLIWLNKIDVVENSPKEPLFQELELYRQLGYAVHLGSIKTGEGLETLKQALKNRTNVLVGQSGVGKSSLVQYLIPDLEVRIGALSHASGLGCHTTTETTLYHLDIGGDLIDSPGIRTLRLAHLDPPRIAQGFREFRPFLGTCRFSDCRHQKEPGCAIRAAADAGQLDPRRVQRYHAIIAGEQAN